MFRVCRLWLGLLLGSALGVCGSDCNFDPLGSTGRILFNIKLNDIVKCILNLQFCSMLCFSCPSAICGRILSVCQHCKMKDYLSPRVPYRGSRGGKTVQAEKAARRAAGCSKAASGAAGCSKAASGAGPAQRRLGMFEMYVKRAREKVNEAALVSTDKALAEASAAIRLAECDLLDFRMRQLEAKTIIDVEENFLEETQADIIDLEEKDSEEKLLPKPPKHPPSLAALLAPPAGFFERLRQNQQEKDQVPMQPKAQSEVSMQPKAQFEVRFPQAAPREVAHSKEELRVTALRCAATALHIAAKSKPVLPVILKAKPKALATKAACGIFL